jgi:6-pyruvoyltetrahydropterin/6-carboxytetrahydropterin synthase
MVIDYADLGKIVDEIETKFDHQHLNEVLAVDMPTSEFLARYIFEMAARQLELPVTLHSVRISETCTTECEYVK